MRPRRTHFSIFLGVLVATPLPLGANRPFAWTFLAALLALLALFWPLAILRERGAPFNAIRPLAIPGVAFFLVLGWAAEQIWGGSISPDLWHPLWGDVAAALATAPGAVGQIGLAPSAGVDGLIRLSSYGLAFWLAYQHAASSRRADAMTDGLAIAAALYAIYGLAAFYSNSNSILWMEKWAYLDNLTSTFVNRNSYATYAGLGLLTALAAISRRMDGVDGWRRLIVHLARPAMLYLFGFGVGLLALLETESRAGIVAAGIGIAVFAYARHGHRLGPWKRAGIALGLVVGIASAFALFLYYGAANPSSEAADRVRVYAATVGLIADRPLLGYGLGSFPNVFAMARPASVSQVWLQAHCLYLELAMELGIPAALLLVGAVAVTFAVCLRAAFRFPERRTEAALGCAATALIATHSLLDFSMQIPAVALTWAAIAGTAMGRVVHAKRSANNRR
jgi:O-antigen ligase